MKCNILGESPMPPLAKRTPPLSICIDYSSIYWTFTWFQALCSALCKCCLISQTFDSHFPEAEIEAHRTKLKHAQALWPIVSSNSRWTQTHQSPKLETPCYKVTASGKNTGRRAQTPTPFENSGLREQYCVHGLPSVCSLEGHDSLRTPNAPYPLGELLQGQDILLSPLFLSSSSSSCSPLF